MHQVPRRNRTLRHPMATTGRMCPPKLPVRLATTPEPAYPDFPDLTAAEIETAHVTPNATPNNPNLPAGVPNIEYVLNSATVDGSNQAVINFQILRDGEALDLLNLPADLTAASNRPVFHSGLCPGPGRDYRTGRIQQPGTRFRTTSNRCLLSNTMTAPWLTTATALSRPQWGTTSRRRISGRRHQAGRGPARLLPGGCGWRRYRGLSAAHTFSGCCR